MNARKGAAGDVLDPFEVGDGWFTLDTVLFDVMPGNALADHIALRVEETISRLRLNDQQCCEARREYALECWNGCIPLRYLDRRAPFVAQELRRLGQLRASDA